VTAKWAENPLAFRAEMSKDRPGSRFPKPKEPSHERVVDADEPENGPLRRVLQQQSG
jgi:hypothetical protein